MLNARNAAGLVEVLKTQVKAPYVDACVSTLGDAERPSVMLSVSLDPKDTWTYGIFQNSRYVRMSIHHDGAMEVFAHGLQCGTKKFRKCAAKSFEDVVGRVNKYLNEVKDAPDTLGRPPKTEHGRYTG